MKPRFFMLGLLVLLPAADTLAQTYPERPIRVIASQSAGSSLDTIARIVANKMSEMFGQQLVIDNRGGAAGTIGIEIGARATPDGYTMIVGASSAMIQKALADPDVKKLYANQGLVPSGSASPEEFAKFFRADFDRNAKLVKIAGIKPE